jgi:hypothetical protein
VWPSPTSSHLDIGCGGCGSAARFAAGSEYTATDTGSDDAATVAESSHVPASGAVYSSHTVLVAGGTTAFLAHASRDRNSQSRLLVGGCAARSPASTVANAVATVAEPDAPAMTVRAAKLSLAGRAVTQQRRDTQACQCDVHDS